VACSEALVAEHTCKVAGYAVIRHSHLIAVVGAFLLGYVVLVVGCAGGRSGAPKEQGRTEATNEQAEGVRCEGTRTIHLQGIGYATNDVPGCPNKGGLLFGTDKQDGLRGEKGDDEIRGLGAADELYGGYGRDVLYGAAGMDFLYGGRDHDVLYGGDGNDILLFGGEGEDVIYGGDGNDYIEASGDGDRDKLYCGEGRDQYAADKIDYMSGSCEVNSRKGPPPKEPTALMLSD
jgi:Ca2+-binding RTX toxin-like protein